VPLEDIVVMSEVGFCLAGELAEFMFLHQIRFTCKGDRIRENYDLLRTLVAGGGGVDNSQACMQKRFFAVHYC
jgi:hypothetical protein